MQALSFDNYHEIALVANGTLDSLSATKQLLESYDCVVAVDGGLNLCHQMSVTPKLMVGDWDSIDQQLLQQYAHIPLLTYPTDKDETDLELALKAVDNTSTKCFVIFAGLGGRTDHLLANVNLLTRYPGRVFLENSSEKMWVIDRSWEMLCRAGQTLSLIPLNGPVEGIVSKGLKWELRSQTLNKDFFGISNVCLTDSVSISVARGDLLCCLQK
jgi:thiamine pyrophosphokinase